ncbi:MAG: ABC-type transport auxiliary lipoprotein family protein [Usitatibacteraceae bacterium]
MSTSIKSSLLLVPLALTALVIAGCQTQPPVPTDRYYRLQAVARDGAAKPILKENLYIATLRAEGQYAERAMLYSSPNLTRELQQYHYQHWSEPPPVLLQEHMRASLEAMALAPRVTTVAAGSGGGYLLNAKILRLEKISEGGSTRAVVSLHMALQKRAPVEVVLERSYGAEETVTENTQHAYVLASEAALKKIYARFADDVKALK